MAKKKAAKTKTSRTDPKQNKSLAIRNTLKKMRNAKGADIVSAVKEDYGHTVSLNQVYMVKTKMNMAKGARRKKTPTQTSSQQMVDASQWVAAIKTARQLLQETGSVPNAIALLKAVDS